MTKSTLAGPDEVELTMYVASGTSAAFYFPTCRMLGSVDGTTFYRAADTYVTASAYSALSAGDKAKCFFQDSTQSATEKPNINRLAQLMAIEVLVLGASTSLEVYTHGDLSSPTVLTSIPAGAIGVHQLDMPIQGGFKIKVNGTGTPAFQVAFISPRTA